MFYRPGALLSQQELSAARLDGLIVEVGDGYMPADLPEDAGARAASLAPIVSPGYAASGPTAAWVHGIGDAPPSRHHIQRAVDHRPRVPPRQNVVVHEGQVPSDDLVLIARLPVTTPLRTLTDLVLAAGRNRDCATWMRSMAAAYPTLVPRVQTLLAARSRMPGKRSALAIVADLAGEQNENARQDEVTRYTS